VEGRKTALGEAFKKKIAAHVQQEFAGFKELCERGS
jgi:hypothetical protein